MKTIAISSSKGGIGKTTVTANLGAALASEFNKNVLLIDGNVTGANLCFHFGLNYPSKTITDCVDGKKDHINSAIYVHSSGVKILPGPVGLDSRLHPRVLNRVVHSIGNDYDYVIIDSAPSLGREALTAIGVANEIIAVSTPDIPSIVNTVKTCDIARRFRKRVFGVVLNQVTNKKYELSTSEVMSMCNGLPVLAKISKSEDIPKSIALQQPLVLLKPNHPISIEIKRVAAHVAGIPYKPKGLLYNLMRTFRLIKEEKPTPIERERKKEIEKAKVVDEVMREVVDVDRLRTELTQEVRAELKESMKKEIMERLKQKLKERGLE